MKRITAGRLRYGSHALMEREPEKNVAGEGIQENAVAGQLVQLVLFASGLYVAAGHARQVPDPFGCPV